MLIIFYVIVVILVICQLISCQTTYRSASSGWSTTFYSASHAMSLNYSNIIGESLTYQPSTGKVIVSNIIGSNSAYTVSLPFSTGINGQTVISSFGPNNNLDGVLESHDGSGTFGTVADELNDDIIWSGIGSFPPPLTATETSCALLQWNSTDGSAINTYSFNEFAQTTGCLIDDVVVVNNGVSDTYAYVTDFFGYQILRANLQNNEVSRVLYSTSYLCTGASPSECTGGSLNGPNGISMYTDSTNTQWLLVNISPNRIVKVNPSNGSATIVNPSINTPPNSLYSMDGMQLYQPTDFAGWLNSVLYVAGGTGPNGSVQVITSTDEWSTYNLRTVYSANCGYPGDTAVRFASNYLIILCNNQFQTQSQNGVMQTVNILQDFVGNAPIGLPIEDISQYYMMPEGFDYDPNRNMLVFGSQYDGTIRGFPYNALGDSYISYNSKDAHVYVQAGTDGIYATAGVQVNPGNAFGDNCYALVCMGSAIAFNADSKPPTGLYLINLCMDSVVSYVSLEVSASTGQSMANDVTVVNSVAYVSDVTGNQVWTVQIEGGLSTGWSLGASQVILNAASCAENDPSFCVSQPDGMESVSASEGTEAFVLISMLDAGLAKYIPTSGKMYKVEDATGLLSQAAFDGMTFNDDYTILYGTRNSFDQENIYQTVFAMTSCNYWSNASLVYSFQVYCGNTNPPAVQLITNSNNQQDMIVMCNDGFGSGPYPILRVSNVNNVVTNNANSVAAGGCSSGRNSNSASNNNKVSSKTGTAIGVGIAILVAVVAAQCIYRKMYLISSDIPSSTTSSKSKPNDGSNFSGGESFALSKI